VFPELSLGGDFLSLRVLWCGCAILTLQQFLLLFIGNIYPKMAIFSEKINWHG